MEYGFAELHGTEVFRAKSGLTGKQVIVEKHEDCIITHRFTITGVIRQQKNCTVYRISDHTTVIDKSEAIKAQLKDQSDALVELASIIGEMGV